MNVPSWASTGIALYLFVFVMSFIQAQVCYWLGRLVVEGTFKGREKNTVIGFIANFFEGPIPQTGAKFLNRWGLPLIPLCFFTIGFQTAVIAGAGIVRMKWPRFTLALIPGVAIKAVLWGTGLIIIWQAILYAIAGDPRAWAVLALIVLAIVTVVIRHRKTKLQQEDTLAISHKANKP